MDLRRGAVLALVVIFGFRGIVAAQSRQPDYNFFDSRTFAPATPTSAALSQAIGQMYRLGGALTPPANAEPETVARAFLTANQDLLSLAGSTVFALPLEHRYESDDGAITHLVFRQQYAGIGIFGGDVLVHVAKDGSVIRVDAGATWPAQASPALASGLSAADAVLAAMKVLAAGAPPDLRVVAPGADAERRTVLAATGLRDPIPARLVWFSKPAAVTLAWELFLHIDGARWYCALVDAATGELLFSHNLYRDQQPKGSVFRAGDVASPNGGPPSVESFTGWPASAGTCPAAIYPAQYRGGGLLNRCWVAGTESAGNNVVACLDATGMNTCDAKAFNPNADFEFPFSNSYALSGDPTPDRSAAITNLFYWNNTLHDWLYSLGFDEVSGNFQSDNFGRGGLGNDPVLADAQDGAGLNNSNFVTPPDGISPRMQMFLFTNNGSFLRRDGDFDGSIIAHEYVHGLTMRLIGGPDNVNVLYLWQSGALAEGWSDAYACSLTNNPVMAGYVSASPATGIRSVAYNNSPYTFGRFGTLYRRSIGALNLVIDLPQVHRDGEIWATVMWDLRSALGRTAFEQAVTAALKLTPVRPSMLDARNAIVQAAQALSIGGANQCAVWSAFAGRGFGASAQLNHVQSGQSRDTALSVYEAYDLPAACGGAPPVSGTAVFFDDAESGASSWTATGLWHLTSRRAAGGTRSWWYGQEATGNYATGARTNGTLTSAPISLAGVTKALLEWDSFFQTEGFGHCYALSSSGCDPYLNYDTGWVQVSRDGGSTWETLTTLAHNSDGTAFDHYKIDFSRYAGSTIRIRFLFDSLDGTTNNYEGWYIDNIAVRRILSSTPVLSVSPTSLNFWAAAGGPNPATQALAVFDADTSAPNWTVSVAGAGWLSVTPLSGTGNGSATVSAAAAGLAAGTYNGTITVTAAGAAGSPATVPVTLTVSGPVADWRFEETAAGSGVLLSDSSGTALDAETHGYGSAAFAGVSGRARAFNGFTDWADAPASAALSPSSLTFRAWVKLLAYPAASGFGVIAANYGGNYQGWYVAAHASGRIIFSVASLPSSAPWLLSTSALALGRWYFLATTYDGATHEMAIYLNGALEAKAAVAGFTPQSSLPMTLGRASWFDGYYLNAVLDEARVLPARQTATQALADYQSFPAPPAATANTALIADWRFDDSGSTLADSSGNAHSGAVSGKASTAGVLNGARRFNGVTDSISVAASDDFSASSFTVRAWVKLLAYPEAAGWGVVVSNYGGNYQGWYLGIHQSGRVIFSVASLPASSPWLLSNGSLALNRWYCIAATYDGASRLGTIYIDGIPSGQAPVAGFTPAASTALYFGRASWYDGYYLNAAIDETRLYPVAKTAAEIAADFQTFPAQPSPPPPAAIAEWRLDDAGSALADSSDNGHAATAHGATTAAGRLNSARSLNGVSDWIEAPASTAFSPASFTLRTWVKLLSYPSGWGALAANYGGNYQGWYAGIHASGRIIFSISSLPASSPWLVSNAALALNTWYHLTLTYDGASRAGTIFLNGAQDAQGVFPGFSPQSAADLFLGRASWYDGYYLNAVLDELRLLGVRQAPAEVLADYQLFP